MICSHGNGFPNCPYCGWSPSLYTNYSTSTTQPAPAKPRPKPGDKRPDKRCTKCQNKGHVNVGLVDGAQVVLVCKLCGKEETEN